MPDSVASLAKSCRPHRSRHGSGEWIGSGIAKLCMGENFLVAGGNRNESCPLMGKFAAATLIDIARICDVNISTVSRALSDDPRVHPNTKKRIAQTAKRLGYRPNLAARMLRARTSRFFWFIAPDLRNPVDGDMVEEAALAAAEREYDVMVSLHLGKQKVFDRIMTAMHSGLAGGAIINRRDIDDLSALHGLVSRDFPIVLVDVPIDSMNLPTVTTDDANACAELVDACVKAGAKSFVVLFNPAYNLVDRRRLDSVLSALSQQGIPHLTGDQIAADSSLSALPRPLALVESHQVAIEKFLAATPRIAAGGDYLIGCYDQWQGSIHPAKRVLVAVQDCKGIARRTVQILVDLLEGRGGADAEVEIPILKILSAG